MTTLQNRLEVFLWFASLVCGLVILQLLGDTYSLPNSSIDAYKEWAETTDTIIVVFSILRVVAISAIAYLLAATVICAIAHRTSRRRLIRVIDAITVPSARSFALRLASISAVGTVVMPAHHAYASADTPAIVESASTASPSELPPTLRMMDRNETAPVASTTTSVGVAPTTTSQTAPIDMLEPTSINETPEPIATHIPYVVGKGENFWTIARDYLAVKLNRQPDDVEITSYWRQLIEHNRQELKNQTNPNLIFPGQKISLPPIPGSITSESN